MTDVSIDDVQDEVRRLIVVAGGSRQWSDTRESWLVRAAYHLGIAPGRARTLFYRKAKTIPAHEYLMLQARVAALQEAATRRQEVLREVADRRLALASATRGPTQHLGDGTSEAAAEPAEEGVDRG